MKPVATAFIAMTFFMPLIMDCNPFGDYERTKAIGKRQKTDGARRKV